MHFKHITTFLATLLVQGSLAAPVSDNNGIAARDTQGFDLDDWRHDGSRNGRSNLKKLIALKALSDRYGDGYEDDGWNKLKTRGEESSFQRLKGLDIKGIDYTKFSDDDNGDELDDLLGEDSSDLDDEDLKKLLLLKGLAGRGGGGRGRSYFDDNGDGGW